MQFNDTKEGKTFYCTHENKNKAGICPACMGQNPLLQLIDEQKLKDSLWCEVLNRFEYTVKNHNIFDNDGYQKEIQYCCDQIINWHISSIKAILQSQVEMWKKQASDFDGCDYAPHDYKIAELLQHQHDEWCEIQINLLTETINSIK